MVQIIDAERLFAKDTDIEVMENMMVSLNNSSSRRTTNPFSFSTFVYTSDRIDVDLCTAHHQVTLHIPSEKYHKNKNPIMHNHDYYELMYVQEGSLQIQIEDTVYTYKKGDLCLFNQKIHHAEIRRTDSAILYCCIGEIFLDKFPKHDFHLYPKHCRPFERFFCENQDADNSDSSNFLEFRSISTAGDQKSHDTFDAFFYLNAMREELKHQMPGSLLIIYGLFCRLLYILSDTSIYDCKYITLKSQNLVDRVIRYMESSQKRVSREDIQSTLNYNCDYLNRIFRQSTGMTLLSYCNYIYMKKAANLLLQTNDTVEEIAESIGFSNPSQFYRQFRKYFHMTPHEYRKTYFELLSQENNFPFPDDEKNI